ncbi:hypothetical protein CGRA01v4_14777 [Colletotrichum graminicola]|nr:hypothetical protein CGRA01v4_14777 [Colletotrichum graminicola]
MLPQSAASRTKTVVSGSSVRRSATLRWLDLVRNDVGVGDAARREEGCSCYPLPPRLGLGLAKE